jgi:branched-chain amino acid transport system ATP-binding protein
MLSVKNISKRFGGISAVSKASLEVNAGEVIALIGPNGAGKSTLIKVIAGLLMPDTGQVKFNGVDISWLFPYKFYRSPSNLGLVLQHTRIVEGLSPIDNIKIGLNPGTGRAFINSLSWWGKRVWRGRTEQAEAWLNELLGKDLPKDAGTLSHGQKRILELLRLRMSQPLAILLDEPTAGLHPDVVTKLSQIISDFKRQGVAIILSEHNINFVEAVSDRIYEMNAGEITFVRSNKPETNIDKKAPVIFVKKETSLPASQGNPLNKSIVKVIDLQGGYNTTPIFHSFSIDIPQSSLTSFIGPNGSGKSTALKAIANLLPWRKGKVIWGINNMLVRRSLLGQPRGISFVLQAHCIFDYLTVKENLLLAADKLPSHMRYEAIERACNEMPQISREWWEKRAGELSGGEQQLLAIARGLVCGPRVLILDEPTAGLSSRAIQDLQSILKKLLRNGTSIIIAEHNMEFVNELSDKIIVFQTGERPREVN